MPFTTAADNKSAYELLAHKLSVNIRKLCPINDTTDDTDLRALLKAMQDQLAALQQSKASTNHQFPPLPPPKLPPLIHQHLTRGAKQAEVVDHSEEEPHAPEAEAKDRIKSKKPRTTSASVLPIHKTKEKDSNPFSVFDRSSKAKVLGTTAPTSNKLNDIKAWIKSLSLSKVKADRITKLIDNLTNQCTKLPKSEQTGLDAIAVDWGLPVRVVYGMPNDSLIKILCYATVLAT